MGEFKIEHGDGVGEVVGFVAPTMGAETTGLRSTQANAMAAMGTPRSAATCSTASMIGPSASASKALATVSASERSPGVPRGRVCPALAVGGVRDIDQTDLIFMQVGLSAILNRSRELEPQLYRRYLAILLDGIRTDRADFTPLPVSPLSADQTHLAMTGARRGSTPK